MWGALRTGGSRTAPTRRGCGGGRGMGPRMREDTGRERRGWLWGAIDSSLRFATFRMTCGVRCAQDDMWGGVRRGGSRTAPTRGGYGGGRGMGPRMREDTGRERDGSPHTRGHGRERDGSPPSRGHGKGEAGLVVGSDRFFTSLHFASLRSE